MASFKICVRKQRKDGLWPVYVRLVHNRKVAYLKTRFMVNADGLSRNGQVRDAYVLKKCMELIEDYAAKLNRRDIQAWDVLRVRRFLESGSRDSSFSRFADSFIDRMERTGRISNAMIYRAALKSLKGYLNTDDIGFELLTREAISGWIDFLGKTKRAKTLYPTCMRLIFNEAVLVSQDPGSAIEPIVYNPWSQIIIPRSDTPRKKAVGVEECRKFFGFRIPSSGKGAKKAQTGRDVALLSFCLAGMNTVDLYKLRKSDLKNGIICYCRSKTEGRRKDNAYMEMRVTPMAAELIEKYKAPDDDERLLSFDRSYSYARSFVSYVDSGIAKVCEMLGLSKEDYYSFYTFRHTWATIARNDCGASLSEVGFAMNHLQRDSVTRGYIKFDFSPAWELNERVMEFVFSPKKYHESDENNKNISSSDVSISASALLRIAAFAGGKCLVSFDDIGYSSVNAVVNKVQEILPADEFRNPKLTVKIVNCDNGKVYVYEHQKGKGF